MERIESVIHIECLVQCLEHRKYSISVAFLTIVTINTATMLLLYTIIVANILGACRPLPVPEL